MEYQNFNQCLRTHASNLNLNNYTSILALEPQLAKEEIDKLNFDSLLKYSELVQEPFKSYNHQGEIQYKSLVKMLTELDPAVSKIQEMFEVVKYIIEVEFTMSLSVDKISTKIEAMTHLTESIRSKVREKLKIISHNELKVIFQSQESLTTFLRN